MYFDETGLAWIMPSPNMPTVDTALVYPGTGIFESTTLSEGRGTTRPFEIIGASFINSMQLAQRMNELHLPGVVFRPLYFAPTFSKYANQTCGGIQIHVTNRNAYQSVRTAA